MFSGHQSIGCLPLSSPLPPKTANSSMIRPGHWSVTVSSKTKAQLIAENTALRARIEELEAAIANGLLEMDKPVENNRVKGSLRMNELKASESRYRRLFETAQDGILILNARTGKIEDANPFLVDLIGYSQAELVGKSLWEIGLFEDVAANLSMYRELKEKGYVR